MFFISLPKTFNIGDTADCRINHEPARVTWRDPGHLVIEPDDARLIIAVDKSSDLIHFACGDANTGREDYEGDILPGGFIVGRKPSEE